MREVIRKGAHVTKARCAQELNRESSFVMLGMQELTTFPFLLFPRSTKNFFLCIICLHWVIVAARGLVLAMSGFFLGETSSGSRAQV